MRVLLIPGYDRNPYLSELAASLRKGGLHVDGVGGLGPAGARERIRLFKNYDVVHVHWTHQYYSARTRRARLRKGAAFLLSIAIARIRGTRFVWTVHNVFAHEKGDKPVERRIGKALVSLASRCIVHCTAARDEVAAQYRLSRSAVAKFTTIPHANYIDSYPRGLSREKARATLGLAPDDRVFTYFGTIRANKRVDALLDAFAEVADEHMKLVIAGRPKNARQADRIKERAADIPGVILVLEFVPDENVQLYMAAADAVVLPHESILTSGSVVLAMSFARAVITPDLGCATDMLGHQTELLYGDEATGLKGALQRALEVDLDELGRRNFDAVQAIAWTEVAKRTAAVYSSAAPSRI